MSYRRYLRLGHAQHSCQLDYLYSIEREQELQLRKTHKASWRYWQQQPIVYNMNSWGFRGAEPVADAALFLGCSMTFGLGMSEQLIWPTLVAQHLGLPCVNLGVCATGNDRASLLAWSWFEELRPRWVFWLDRFQNRREWLVRSHSKDSRILQSPDTTTLGRIAASEAQTLFDEQRNLALVQRECDRVGATLVRLSNEQYHTPAILGTPSESDLFSRDNGLHPSREEHARLAEWFIRRVDR